MASTRKILGMESLRRKFKALPEAIAADVRYEMERVAEQVCDTARNLVPYDEGELHDSIGWTWGDPPRGSLILGLVKRRAGSRVGMRITIFAGDERAFWVRWVEFGTAPHVNKGLFPGTDNPGTAARPFFYPAWRANKKSVRRAVRKAVVAAGKKVASS